MSRCKCDSCNRPAWKDEYCKGHHPATQRKARKDNPERFKKYSLRRDYGISLELYQKILVEQGGVCAICGVPSGSERSNRGYKSLAIDHDHRTGNVRGLLCGNCNKGIGSLMDSSIILRRAAVYLERQTVFEDPLSVDSMLKRLCDT